MKTMIAKKLGLSLLMLFQFMQIWAQKPDMITLFKQGDAKGHGNCASIAIIKAAIAEFGVDSVFTTITDSSKHTVLLKDGIKVEITFAEIAETKLFHGFDTLGRKLNSNQKKAFEYAELCYAVMAARVKQIGDGGNLSAPTESYSCIKIRNAINDLNDGAYAPTVYHLLGLSNYVITPRWFTKIRTNGIAWSNAHAVYVRNNKMDMHGKPKKPWFKYFGRQILDKGKQPQDSFKKLKPFKYSCPPL